MWLAILVSGRVTANGSGVPDEIQESSQTSLPHAPFSSGHSLERLTTTENTEFYPYWGRFTNKIAFTKNHDIYTMDENGNNVQNITNSPGIIETQPCISPDGTKIVFQQTTTQEEENLYIMDIDGLNKRRITNSPYSDNAPDWR